MPENGRWDLTRRLKVKGAVNLTLTLLKWKIWWVPNNASRWQMGYNSSFKGLKHPWPEQYLEFPKSLKVHYIVHKITRLLPSWSKMKPLCTLTSCIFKIFLILSSLIPLVHFSFRYVTVQKIGFYPTFRVDYCICICTVHVIRSLNCQYQHMHNFNVTG
jgi:hypothetical protein